ncbi:MAG: metallophosphoesterase [Acidimicrobiales bacterium]|nr:metallophosphoesterase [Acidimicrobiales bacterium]
MADSTFLRVVQVTDTHVTAAPGAPTVLGLLADIDAGDPMVHLDLVLDHIADLDPAPDVLVGTGDLADTGDPAAYQRWRERFLRLGVPVWVLPGNHDLAEAFDTHLVGPGVHAATSSRHGGWEFLYVRTGNTEWGEIDPSDAEELRTVLAGDDRVRAIAAGHVHVAAEHDLDGVPVYLAPSTYTGRPAPGYRTFDLHDDGTVVADVHHIEGRFTFDATQVARLVAMANARYAAEPEARRGAGQHARAEVEAWRDAVSARLGRDD